MFQLLPIHLVVKDNPKQLVLMFKSKFVQDKLFIFDPEILKIWNNSS